MVTEEQSGQHLALTLCRTHYQTLAECLVCLSARPCWGMVINETLFIP